MKNKFIFLKQFLKDPKKIGSIIPSTKSLGNSMIKDIDFSQNLIIVEYGPGTGIFTDLIVNKINDDSKLILIENNEEFFLLLNEKYKNKKNIIIIFDSAINITSIIKNTYNIDYVDYVISGLPFSSLPKIISQKIIKETKKVIGNKGVFITFQYSKFKEKLFRKYFDNIIYKRVIKNIPPAYVLKMFND